MKKFVCVLLMIMAVAAFAGCGKKDEDVSGGEGSESGAGQETAVEGKHHVEITVKDYGTISVELDGDAAPVTVANFLKLAGDGFYDGLTFHRIVSGFMIQGGDPTGTGRGGSDEAILGEFSQNGVENNLSSLVWGGLFSFFFYLLIDLPYTLTDYICFTQTCFLATDFKYFDILI